MRRGLLRSSSLSLASSRLTKYSPYVHGLRSNEHCRATSVMFECGCMEIREVFGAEHYANGVDKLRRNFGFDRRVGRWRKKHP
jgi:hypothetical protein